MDLNKKKRALLNKKELFWQHKWNRQRMSVARGYGFWGAVRGGYKVAMSKRGGGSVRSGD